MKIKKCVSCNRELNDFQRKRKMLVCSECCRYQKSGLITFKKFLGNGGRDIDGYCCRDNKLA